MENFKTPIRENQELDHWLCKVKIRTLKKKKKTASKWIHSSKKLHKKKMSISHPQKNCARLYSSLYLKNAWEAVPLETTKFEMGNRRTLYCHK